MRLCTKTKSCQRNAEVECQVCHTRFCDEHNPKSDKKGWRMHCGKPVFQVADLELGVFKGDLPCPK